MIYLSKSANALTPGRRSSLFVTGGTAPFTYEVLPGGAGGSVNEFGIYSAPEIVNPDPSKAFDQIEVTDADGESATTEIFVTNTLGIFCDILQTELELANGRVYLFNEKIMKPTDSGLYIAVSVVSDRPFGNVNRFKGSGSITTEQYITVVSRLGVDIMSRSHEARDRRFEAMMALVSDYSIRQQELNGFQISRLPLAAQISNLSAVDGAAIPFRFHFDVSITHSVMKVAPATYYSKFETAVEINS